MKSEETDKEIDLGSDKLKEVANSLGISFKTVAKAYEGTQKNWRNCEVGGHRVRDLIRKEFTQ